MSRRDRGARAPLEAGGGLCTAEVLDEGWAEWDRAIQQIDEEAPAAHEPEGHRLLGCEQLAPPSAARWWVAAECLRRQHGERPGSSEHNPDALRRSS